MTPEESEGFWHQQEQTERRRLENELLDKDLEYQKWLDEFDSQFSEQEVERMVDMAKYAQSDSEWLKAADFQGKSFKLVISEAGETEMPDWEDKTKMHMKPFLRFEDRDKGIILNAANTKLLIGAYGGDSDSWVGKEIAIVSTFFDGVGKYGWVVEILNREFDDDIPF